MSSATAAVTSSAPAASPASDSSTVSPSATRAQRRKRGPSVWFQALQQLAQPSAQPQPASLSPRRPEADPAPADPSEPWSFAADSSDPAASALARHAAALARDLDQTERAEAALRGALTADAAGCRADAAIRLGERLLGISGPERPRSRKRAGADSESPAVLLRELMQSAEGCQWLLDRWLELAARFDRGLSWGLPELLRFLRLLGKRPLEAVYDEEANTVVAAFEPLCPRAGQRLLDAFGAGPGGGAAGFLGHRTWRPFSEPPSNVSGSAEVLLITLAQQMRQLRDRYDELAKRGAPVEAILAGDPRLERLRKQRLALGRELRQTLALLARQPAAKRSPRGEKAAEAEIAPTHPQQNPPSGTAGAQEDRMKGKVEGEPLQQTLTRPSATLSPRKEDSSISDAEGEGAPQGRTRSDPSGPDPHPFLDHPVSEERRLFHPSP